MLSPTELVWLLAATAKGDAEAFERLYLATRTKLYGVTLRILRRNDLAEEILQEAYVKIWRNAGDFNPRLASPITWMVAITRNAAFDVLRKKTEVSIEDEPQAIEVSAETRDPLAQREMTEQMQKLLGCMGRLEEEHRRVVLLAYYNGWSREQLASKFETPVNTIKTWLRRGLIQNPGVHGLMSDADDDKDVLAAEFVLGTLDSDDRANAQMLMAIDPAFAGKVAHWERRLGELHALVEPVDPPASNWEWIKARIAAAEQSKQLWLPERDEAAAATLAPAPGEPSAGDAHAAGQKPRGEVVDMSHRLRRWQRLTVAAGALAATVAGITVLREARPVLLPAFMRPAPQIVERVVEVVREVPSQRVAEFVAVFQRDDALPAPAFLLTVDVERKTVSLRRVGAEQQADKSYELWIVTPQQQRPRSLGLLAEEPFTVRRALADYDAPTLHNATFGISLEPTGGSPTGQPTGPVIHGRLVQTTPAAYPGGTP